MVAPFANFPKNGIRDSQNSPPFERSACFYAITTGNFNVFTTLSLILVFWKTKTFFKNLEYHFLVQTTKIECAIFPYMTAPSKANVKTNRMGSIKWTYYKGWSFASNCFIFLKILFQSRTSSKQLIRCTNYSNAPIHTFRKRMVFYLNVLFSLRVSLRNSYKHIMCSYEKWASPPKWDLTWFCRDPTWVRWKFSLWLRTNRSARQGGIEFSF